MSGLFVDIGDPTNPPVIDLSWMTPVVEIDLSVGIPGRQGPPGQDAAAAPRTFQLSGVSSWSMTHTFPYLPSLRFVLPDGTPALHSWQYVSSTEVYVEFLTPFTGTITLS